MKKKWKKYLGLGLLMALVIMQFFKIDKSKPVSPAEQDFIISQTIPNSVGNHLKNACYDCHSNDTKYPWYTNLAPISFLIKGHINGGRHHLNFSEWTAYTDQQKNHMIEEIIEVIEDGEMPMKSYTWLHSEAKLSEQQKKEMTDFFKSL